MQCGRQRSSQGHVWMQNIWCFQKYVSDYFGGMHRSYPAILSACKSVKLLPLGFDGGVIPNHWGERLVCDVLFGYKQAVETLVSKCAPSLFVQRNFNISYLFNFRISNALIRIYILKFRISFNFTEKRKLLRRQNFCFKHFQTMNPGIFQTAHMSVSEPTQVKFHFKNSSKQTPALI